MLQISELTKTYANGVQALRNVTLAIPNGLFGLLGPNGAGKSSLMRTIATLQDPDTGTIFFRDGNTNIDILKDKQAVRQILGYLPQEFGVYPTVSAEEMLNHIAILKGISQSKERAESVKTLLQQTNLYEVRKKSLGGYSGGMKQRFGIAQALLGNPRIIIVDEPTAGLDPTERNRFLNLLSEISQNVVVILSTHIVEDVKELCPNMAIINKGEVLFAGSPHEALQTIKGKIWRTIVPKQVAQDLAADYRIISTKFNTGQMEVRILSEEKPANDNLENVEPQLEDIYFCKINKML